MARFRVVDEKPEIEAVFPDPKVIGRFPGLEESPLARVWPIDPRMESMEKLMHNSSQIKRLSLSSRCFPIADNVETEKNQV